MGTALDYTLSTTGFIHISLQDLKYYDSRPGLKLIVILIEESASLEDRYFIPKPTAAFLIDYQNNNLCLDRKSVV